jgi:FtsP/CotA-like multicopper oxidase with cupredoxin domain
MRAHSGKLQTAAALIAVLGLTGWVGWSWYQSLVPDTYNVMDYGPVDYGGGPQTAAHHSVGVDRLTGPEQGTPDFTRTLTAERTTIRLRSGRRIDAWAFDGRVPGPKLTVHQGDLVEVTLVNEDIGDGVSIHWHGVDVPNADDGVSGVTQDAVMPGERYTYRFRVQQQGTFWYHSHQQSSHQVERGLYGVLVVLPRRGLPSGTLDLTAVAHSFTGTQALGTNDGAQPRAVATGTPVRLRLVNTDSSTQRFALGGTPFRVVAIDGDDLSGPTPMTGKTVVVPAGGRYDLAFTMPRSPVKLAVEGALASLVLSPDGRGDPGAVAFGSAFDPASYGRQQPDVISPSSHFDRTFDVKIGKKLGWQDGRPGRHWSVNGHVFPDMPMFVVRRGDLVKIRFENDSGSVHPMHLHGHHLQVLTRNGQPVRGSPWVVDTLDVGNGDTYETAFRAVNPGVWMLHCHNLPHAAQGLVFHVMYEGVTTPYDVGGPAHNHPE